MRGGLFIIRQDGKIEQREINHAPTGNELHEIVDGYIELVPYWNLLTVPGINSGCVAFCDENGKNTGKLLNETATAMWESVLNRQGKSSVGLDYLAGDIVVVWGDHSLLDTL